MSADPAVDLPTKNGIPERTYRLAFCLILLVITALLFSPMTRHDFVDWDDPENVTENVYYLPVTAESLPRFWKAPYNSLYMPVTYTVWTWCADAGWSNPPLPRPDGGVNQLNPAPFHMASTLLHLCSVLLAFTLVRFLLERLKPDTPPLQRDIAAFLGAALFAVHPLQIEAVAWVTGTNNLTAGVFMLAALQVYLSTADRHRERGGFSWGIVASTILYILALLSKPTAAALPLVALFLDITVIKRPLRQIIPLIAVWCGLAFACMLITQSSSKDVNAGLYLPIWGRPFIVGDAMAFYLGKLFYPMQLCVDYGRVPRLVLHSWWGYTTWLIPAGLALAAWRLRWRGISTGLGIFFLFALPMLGVVPFYFQHHSTVADRYLYVAMLGTALALAWLLVQCSEQYRRIAYIGAGAALLLLASVSAVQLKYWRDTTSLFEQVLVVNPQSVTAYNNLGTVWNRQGDPDKANTYFLKALKISNTDFHAYYNLGTNLGKHGLYADALPYLEMAIKINPKDASAHNNRGLILENMGRKDEAISEFSTALQLSPDFAPARINRDRLVSAGKSEKIK